MAKRNRPDVNKLQTGITVVKPTDGGNTVVVCCKMPNGFHLDINQPTGKLRVSVRGTNAGAIVQGRKLHPSGIEIAGYGLTRGVDKEFWDKWLELNKEMPYVKQGLIFAYADLESASDFARDGEDVFNGLEALDPDNPIVDGARLDVQPFAAEA